jgi:hypothetical protein
MLKYIFKNISKMLNLCIIPKLALSFKIIIGGDVKDMKCKKCGGTIKLSIG